MTFYFPRRNWEPKLYSRLNQLIDDHKKANDLPQDQRDYVVLDCDDTTLFSDTETEALYYFLEHLMFDWTPQEFQELLFSGDFDYRQAFLSDYPHYTGENFVHDIVEAYQELYDLYISKSAVDRPLLKDLQETEAFANFFVKYIMFYNLQWSLSYEKPGASNAVAFFAGYSRSDLIRITEKMSQEFMAAPISQKRVESSSTKVGKTGQMAVRIKKGMRIPQEMLDLYQALQDNGITPYVVSGSPQELVATILGKHFYLPFNHIFSMKYAYEDGRLSEKFSKHWPTTLGHGKVTTIDEKIMPLHQGRQPLAVFGNSAGDYDMLTAYDGMEMGIFFNRNLKDRSLALVEQAVEEYDQADPKYHLQGIDENTGQFIPNQATIPLGSSEPLLFAKDEVVINKYHV